MPTLTGAQGIESDDFYEGTLNGATPSPEWAVTDPTGGGSTAFENVAGQRTINLTIPSTVHHDVATLSHYRVLQPATNGPFTIETSVTTTPTFGTETGIYIRNSDNSIAILFGPWTDDGGANNLYSSHYGTGSWTDWYSNPLTYTSPMYLRVVRDGDNWSFYHGSVRTSLTQWSTTQSLPMTVSHVGLYVANWGGNWNGVTVKLDYFMENTGADFFAYEDSGTTTGSGTRRIFIIT
jgi:hypothetical protein